MTPLRVLLATSWDTACGIADHAAQLRTAVMTADPGIEVIPSAEALDPDAVLRMRALGHTWDLLHLNHHDALHSRWTPQHVAAWTGTLPVLVTYHDTRAGTADQPNSDKLKALAQVASSVVVHEPVEDVRAIYWRQGIPAAATYPAVYSDRGCWWDGWRYGHDCEWKAFPQQPVLGTLGFNFPWKNYDRLAQVTGEEGWALVLLANNATPEDEARWRSLNSAILVVRDFLPGPVAVNYLAGCDATAFMYECANTGTSGAIRQGIAARKPVIALSTCRQFRDLYCDTLESGLGWAAIDWVHGWDELPHTLHRLPLERVNPRVHALAQRDSWVELGKNYAALYRMLAEKRG